MSTANSNFSPVRVPISPPPYTPRASTTAPSSVVNSPARNTSNTKRPTFTHGDLVVIFTALSCVLMFFTRYNMSVAIVGMVKPTAFKLHFSNQTLTANHSGLEGTLLPVKLNAAAVGSPGFSVEINEGKVLNQTATIESSRRLEDYMDWDTDTESYVLSAYFYG